MSFPALADYKAGMDALAVKDFARARIEFESEPNNGASIYQLSLLARMGLGETRNETRSSALLERASKAGHEIASIDYAYALGNGRGIEKNVPLAVATLEKLAAAGNSEAQGTLATAMYVGWWGMAKDTVRASGLAKQSAEGGNRLGKVLYAECLMLGVGVPKDEKAGVDLLRETADLGDGPALVNLARLTLRGEHGITKDPVASVELYRKAADSGNRVAQHALAVAYYYGVGVTKDMDAAMRWADASARQGDPWGQLMLAEAFQSGVGMPRMRGEAYYWYTVASRGTTSAAERANERRANLAKDMKQEEIESVIRRADLFQVQAMKPRAVPLPALSHNDTISVGGTRIDVPYPRGYINGWQFAEAMQRAYPNDPNMRPLLVVLTRQEDMDRVKLGIPGPYRSVEVAEFGTGTSVAITPPLFLDVKKQMRTFVDQSVTSGVYRLEEVVRDDENVYSVLRSGVSQGNKLDGVAFALVKQRVIWFTFSGFQLEHKAELKELMKSSVDDVLSSNRRFFGG